MGFTDTDTSNQAVTPERAYENRKQMFQHEFEQKGRELMEILERRCGEVNEDYDLAEAEVNIGLIFQDLGLWSSVCSQASYVNVLAASKKTFRNGGGVPSDKEEFGKDRKSVV